MNNKIKISKKSEKKLAKKINGKLKSGSGNTWRSKGDVVTLQFLIDDKTSIKAKEMKSFTINKEKFYKHYKDAIIENKIGIYRINMGNKGLIVIDENDFWELVETKLNNK
ncbi:MAG: hypothetical protein SNJ64_05210 [Endomicrobiia bacterium]